MRMFVMIIIEAFFAHWTCSMTQVHKYGVVLLHGRSPHGPFPTSIWGMPFTHFFPRKKAFRPTIILMFPFVLIPTLMILPDLNKAQIGQ